MSVLLPNSCKCNNGHLGAVSPEMIGKIVEGASQVGSKLISMREDKWDYPQCGKKPFLPFGRKRREYNDCIQQMAINQQKQGYHSDPNLGKSFFEKYQTPILVGGAVILIGGFLYVKNK